ncbi:MAG: molybdopterin-synthase adenylyltransferase MoeB [Segetibacter sp.]|nr:molybdopterin-synthase adenylyltransferase MoeB [Segetibacter sp.]
MQAHDYERYNRQMILPQFGEEGQHKLFNAKILVVGAGGLGCPVLQYLTAAGVGEIGIIDDDIISLSNLHRQILYATDDLNKYKTEVAADKLKRLNPSVTFHVFTESLTNSNAIEIISRFDIVADGTDNFAARYVINDACVLLQKPFVSAAISRFEGQVAVFNVYTASGFSVNYRDLFPTPPTHTLNCEEAGVLGTLPGIAGSLQANEVIKMITGIGEPLINRLLTFNALNNSFYQLDIVPDEEGRKLIPANIEAFLDMDYEVLCSASSHQDVDITVEQLKELQQKEKVTILDVREMNEVPTIVEDHIRVPLRLLKNKPPLVTTNTIVAVCHMGIRSAEAVKILKEIYGSTRKIYNLEGGILSWQKYLYKKQQHA